MSNDRPDCQLPIPGEAPGALPAPTEALPRAGEQDAGPHAPNVQTELFGRAPADQLDIDQEV